jgi:hypothetical protein
MRYVGRALTLALVLIGGFPPTAQAQCARSCRLVTPVGAKLNVWQNLLLSGNVLFPLTSSG